MGENGLFTPPRKRLGWKGKVKSTNRARFTAKELGKSQPVRAQHVFLKLPFLRSEDPRDLIINLPKRNRKLFFAFLPLAKNFGGVSSQLFVRKCTINNYFFSLFPPDAHSGSHPAQLPPDEHGVL